MGEFEQPIIGMKSCFDHLEIDGKHGWSAREWFLVRKAEVHISEESMLIPVVKMGVEAREQVIRNGILEDKPITQTDHPMVKYAEDFTRNFDLIAERKSSVFNLRELAKAAVMSKYLLDAGTQLDEVWFNLAGSDERACSLEVPQLWNERIYSQVCLINGSLRDEQTVQSHGVYGGVQFGLEKFALVPTHAARPTSIFEDRRAGQEAPGKIRQDWARRPQGPLTLSALNGSSPLFTQPPPQAALALAGAARRTVELAQALSAASLGPRIERPIGAIEVGEVPGVPSRPPVPGVEIEAAKVPARLRPPVSNIMSLASTAQFAPRAAPSPLLQPPPIRAADAKPAIHGVDLRLDQFDLSEAKKTLLEVPPGSWSGHVKPLDQCVSIGSSFFACLDLDSAENLLKPEDHVLLRKVFDPTLSDRRHEGDLFLPPDTSPSYVSGLRELVKREDEVREDRKQAFFSPYFMMENPGVLFPHSWTPSCGISRDTELALEGWLNGSLTPRPEYKAHASFLLEHLKDVTPVFDKKAEDGACFRIYRLGSLEVRTTQMLECNEVIGAVFSMRKRSAETIDSQLESIGEGEQVTKANEYVERVFERGDDGKGVSCHYYLVLETTLGNTILLERVSDEQFSCVTNPDDLDDRNSLAKLTRSENCSGVTVGDILKSLSTFATAHMPSSKRFVQAMLVAAAGVRRISARDVKPFRFKP